MSLQCDNLSGELQDQWSSSSEKRNRPKGFICPCTGVKYHNIQTCLLVYAADSGERLQDHWSSGLNFTENVYCCNRHHHMSSRHFHMTLQTPTIVVTVTCPFISYILLDIIHSITAQCHMTKLVIYNFL